MLERNEKGEAVEFKKTKLEKEAAKTAKRLNKTPFGRSINPIKEGGLKGKLSIFVENKEKSNTFRTTHSYSCTEDEISLIKERVRSMTYDNGSPYVIIKSTFNGREI